MNTEESFEYEVKRAQTEASSGRDQSEADKEVEEYLDSQPDDLIGLVISGRGLTKLPDLSRFTRLQRLYCSDNELTELINLPKTLLRLDCSANNLTKLPALPENLQFLDCSYNMLTSLPPFPDSLKQVDCSYNPRYDE